MNRMHTGISRNSLYPAASMGHHVLRFHDRDIPLGTREGRDGRIHVKLARIPVLAYLPVLFGDSVWKTRRVRG